VAQEGFVCDGDGGCLVGVGLIGDQQAGIDEGIDEALGVRGGFQAVERGAAAGGLGVFGERDELLPERIKLGLCFGWEGRENRFST